MAWFQKKVTCPVHILDPTRPERVETWTIGERVRLDEYERVKDEDGHLHAVVHYVDGIPSIHLVPKAEWARLKHEAFSASVPSSLDEHFEYQYQKLLASDADAQLVAAAAINTEWHAFNDEFPSFESFTSDEAVSTNYLIKMNETIKKMAADEFLDRAPEGMSRGVFLVYLYLVAVLKKDARMVNHIADALEPFNKMAHDGLNVPE